MSSLATETLTVSHLAILPSPSRTRELSLHCNALHCKASIMERRQRWLMDGVTRMSSMWNLYAQCFG